MVRFDSLASAQQYRDGCGRVMLIVRGLEGEFWVATPSMAERLVRWGREYAE